MHLGSAFKPYPLVAADISGISPGSDFCPGRTPRACSHDARLGFGQMSDDAMSFRQFSDGSRRRNATREAEMAITINATNCALRRHDQR